MLFLAGAAVPPVAGTTGSDGAGPATAIPDAAIPDMTRSDTASPDTANPDTANPGTTRPDASNPAAPNPAVEAPAKSIPSDSAPVSSPAAGGEACLANQACVDRYLWSLYERTPKVDTVNVSSQTKVTVKRKGKTRTVTRTVTTPVGEDFAWKDPKAAGLAGMAPMDYVIGGVDPGFRVTLYRALYALDEAGFKPGITCAFRDDYRQSIATGLKAQNDRSYHGGSFRGGYGHGMAADIVSVRGETRIERLASSTEMWAFIDQHEKDLGIGRPYLDRDPPHVAPLDGREYADHRARPQVQHADAAGRKAESRKAETKKAEAKKIEAKKIEAKKAGAKKAEAKKAEAKKAEAKKAELKKAELKKAELKKAGAKKAEARRLEARKADRSQDRNPGRIHDLAVHRDHDAVRRTKVTSPAKPPLRARTPAI
jgi:hypothetical protein